MQTRGNTYGYEIQRLPTVRKLTRHGDMAVIHHELVDTICSFLAETGMSRSQFGKLSINDYGLVSDLERGRELKRVTERRILDFINNYLAETQEAAE